MTLERPFTTDHSCGPRPDRPAPGSPRPVLARPLPVGPSLSAAARSRAALGGRPHAGGARGSGRPRAAGRPGAARRGPRVGRNRGGAGERRLRGRRRPAGPRPGLPRRPRRRRPAWRPPGAGRPRSRRRSQHTGKRRGMLRQQPAYGACAGRSRGGRAWTVHAQPLAACGPRTGLPASGLLSPGSQSLMVSLQLPATARARVHEPKQRNVCSSILCFLYPIPGLPR